jgi:diguanylate cyclase (GGDEF)-like protein/PAS domain S-box-containing protein
MFWFGYQLYTTELRSALLIEQQANEALRDQIESELKRLKTVFHNKVDPLTPLVDEIDNPSTLKEINRYLDFILERELAVRKIMILSKKGEVIAAIDPNIEIMVEQELSIEQLQIFKVHWGFDNINEPPELVIPLFGRDYISSPQNHEGFMAFTMAVPIGTPAKAVLILIIDIDRLWRRNKQKEYGVGLEVTRNYLLDRRGALIAIASNHLYKVGDLMTHFSIVRSALVDEPWQTKRSYLGINNRSVFGIKTTIPSLNWTLVSEVISFEITQPIWFALAKVFAIILPVLALFIWVILYLAKKTIRPIQAVCEATHQVAQGDYQVALASCGIQELDNLALDFNLMAKSRKKAEERLQLSDRVFRETHDGIAITDISGAIVDINPSFYEITGYSREEVIGKNPHILYSGKQTSEFYALMWKTINEQGYWQGEIWNRKKNGELYAELLNISVLKDENNHILYYVGIFSDITHSKKQQEKLEQMVHYDVLTQLPNRVLLVDRFSQALAYCRRQKTLLAVCFLDLDDFKPINDSYGHETGDKLLIEVANRIKANIRVDDTVSRQGGDEFALLLGNINSFSQCEEMLKRIIKALAEPYVIDKQSLSISASVGVTLYPMDNVDFDTLIRHADQAMYQAKLAGRNRYHLFNTEQDQQSIQKTIQCKEIQQALLNDELCLYYQPKVDMTTGKVFGVEALIRWNHPLKGLISPLEFLPITDETELEVQLGNWVINEALKQMDAWRGQAIVLEVSVNISSFHLQSPTFIIELDKTLALYPKVNSKYLQLEILESSALGDLQSIRRIIKSCIESLGVNIALDDFGTGYSSLTHLRNLPVQTVKIDQTFVRDMLDDPNDYAIIDSVIGLADSFNRNIIAEGVETCDHGLMLLLMGCNKAQGYGIAKPMPTNQIPKWLKNYSFNQEWVICANTDRTPKQKKIKLFQLILFHWQKHFETNIQSQPENVNTWLMMNKTKCHCGIWINREKQEKLFDADWLEKFDEGHELMHDIADNLFKKYQKGQIDMARAGLIDFQIAVKNVESILRQSE